FLSIEDEMARRALAGEDPFKAVYPFNDQAAQAAQTAMIEVSGKANVFDTQKAFCAAGGSASCEAYVGRELLLVDPDHISSAGALAIGRSMKLFLFDDNRTSDSLPGADAAEASVSSSP